MADCGWRIWEKDVTRSELEKRTKDFAIAVIRFVEKVPKNKAAQLMGSAAVTIGHIDWRELSRGQSRRKSPRFHT